MVFNTLTVSAAVTPSVIETYFSHYLNRAPLRQKPTAHISYHEGLRLIREFLDYSSKHTVEDLQNFTAQWVPCPSWVRINDAEIAPKFLERAAQLLQAQLGRRGLEMIGGKTWWQWRRQELRAEWIEMKKDWQERKLKGTKCDKVMLYVHGGAYYFGSVDEHRYQMQRHARKLKASVLSPRYRLAPQYPFPCGLCDCLATYFYLLEHFSPSQILIAGDSAGAGMVLSMLVVLRDQAIDLPAGTILLSPWADLTHSFPSVAGHGVGDYIPPHGFHHKPSLAWPPPPIEESKDRSVNKENSEGIPNGAVELPAAADLDINQQHKRVKNGDDDVDGEEEDDSTNSLPHKQHASPPSVIPRFGDSLNITLDGKNTELRDQIQLYTTNALLAHPLVSPVMQPSLGGLPPMLIQTGGAELLRDEQIYVAHKAANPTAYPPNETIMREFDPSRKTIERWPPTDVQIQLWEDLCHVPHTLSFTRPAKYMYRSVAQFATWALARAQEKTPTIPNDDALSVISSDNEGTEDGESLADSFADSKRSPISKKKSKENLKASAAAVGTAGDPLPPFRDHMIRQRVTRHGIIQPLPPPSDLTCLTLDPASIGVPKAGPVQKWLTARQTSNAKFANERKKVEKKRAKEVASGYDVIPGERPPPTALVNRRRKGAVPVEKKKGRSWGLAMWSGWGSNHDEQTLKQAGRKNSAGSAPVLQRSQSRAGYLDPPEGTGEKKRRMSSVSLPIPCTSPMLDRLGSTHGDDSRPTDNEDVAVDAVNVDEGSRDVISRPNTALSAPISGDIFSRPIRNSFSSPIPVDSEMQHRRQESRNAREAPIALPPTIAVSPINEVVSEADNSYFGNIDSGAANATDAYSAGLGEVNSGTTTVTQLPVSRAVTEPPAFHSELMGDAPAPVELPSVTEHETEEGNATSSNTTETRSASPSLQFTAETRSATTLAPPTPDDRDELVSPITPAEDTTTDKGRVSPFEQSAPQVFPFKLRNQVFNPRTSMLGSIGADGMPNAHYAFKRDDSQRRKDPPSDGTTPEPENKAPFKMRHTVYEPEGAFAVQAPQSLQVLNDPAADSVSNKQSSSSPFRESGVLGLQLGGQRIVGDQSNGPASYEDDPTTNMAIPENSTGSPIVKEAKEDESDDVPPTPPPKDVKPINVDKKIFGLRKPTQTPNPVASTISSGTSTKTSGSAPPVIGELGFERLDFDTFMTTRESDSLLRL